MWVRYVTRFFITGSRSSPPRSKEDSQKIYCPTTTILQRSQALQKRVDDPQVILRPRLSTSGRSNQQRLFLRHPTCSPTFVWTVQPTRSKACEGKQGQDSNLTSMVLFDQDELARSSLYASRHQPERRRFHPKSATRVWVDARLRLVNASLHGHLCAVSVRCPPATVQVRVLRPTHWPSLHRL